MNKDILSAVSECQTLEGDLYLGVDIGTTSISAAVTNGESSVAFSLPNESAIPAENGRYEQNSNIITDRVFGIVNAVIDKFPDIRGIGFDGQMHGIVYTDDSGIAVSNLITWQDCRGDIPFVNGESACEKIYRLTGYKIYGGYGLATHFYNAENGLVPKKAVSFCTIADYAVMRLCGLKRPLVHPSNAASMGIFDIKNSRFDKEAVGVLGLDANMLPEVSEKVCQAGEYRGIPVNIAIGDNQAAYYGVMPDGGVLCNFGTGSQVSVDSDEYREIPGIECRPYVGGKFILSGSALCGGRAYALLEKFFREFTGSEEKQYKRLDKLAEEAYSSGTALDVSTLFCGTRADPSLRGSISGISEDNFTPGALAYGFLKGMANELYGYYKLTNLPDPDSVTVSGNAASKSVTLQKIIGDTFKSKVTVSTTKEEAACGSALLTLKGE